MGHWTHEWLILALCWEHGQMSTLSYGLIWFGGDNCRWYCEDRFLVGQQWKYEWPFFFWTHFHALEGTEPHVACYILVPSFCCCFPHVLILLKSNALSQGQMSCWCEWLLWTPYNQSWWYREAHFFMGHLPLTWVHWNWCWWHHVGAFLMECGRENGSYGPILIQGCKMLMVSRGPIIGGIERY